MTRKCVTDDQYGQLKRRTDELTRRVDEGTLPFDQTMRALQYFIEGKFRFGNGAENVASAPVSTKPLQDLISAGNFGYVNSNITEANFPDIGVKTDFKVYDFKKTVSSDFAIEQMKKDGYRPANLRELLNWMSVNWNGKDWVVALGQIWRDSDGSRSVPCLYFGSGRGLSLDWYGSDWGSDCRFLAVRNS